MFLFLPSFWIAWGGDSFLVSDLWTKSWWALGKLISFSWATLQPANPFCLLDKLCSAQVPGAWYLSMPHCLTSLWLGIRGRAALRLLQVLRSRQGLGYSRSFCQVGAVAQYVCVSTTTLREGVAVNPRSSQTPPRRIWTPSTWAAAFKSG